MRCLLAPLIVLAVAAAGSISAQPKAEALAKAKTKFEQDISKAEDAFIAAIDKASMKAQAAKNMALVEKLAYEREQFVNNRIIPTSVPTPTGTYLRQRTQAITALEAVYFPAIKDLTRTKKADEAEALENALGDLLRTARGYGLAVPELSARPQLVLENKASGQVLEGVELDHGLTVLGAKAGKRKPLQCWHLERDEKGWTLVNVGSGRAAATSNRLADGKLVPILATHKLDPQKETPDRFLFRLDETRREVVIASLAKGESNGYVLAAAEKKQKGMTVYELVIEKKENPPKPNQIWTITEAK
jgi:hypothetical protein